MTPPKRCPTCYKRLGAESVHICQADRPEPKPKAIKKNTAGELRPRRGMAAAWIDE